MSSAMFVPQTTATDTPILLGSFNRRTWTWTASPVQRQTHTAKAKSLLERFIKKIWRNSKQPHYKLSTFWILKKLHQETIFIHTMPKHRDFHSGLLPTYLKTMSTHRNLVPTPLYCRQAPSHFRHLIPQRRPNANQLVTQCCRPPHCKLCQPLKCRHSASPNTHASTNCFKAPTNRHASPRHLSFFLHTSLSISLFVYFARYESTCLST